MSVSRRRWIALSLLLATIGAAAAIPVSRWSWSRRRAGYAAGCRAARAGRQWDELQRLAGDWSRRDPQSADPWLFLAEAAEGRHDGPATAAALANIPESDPRALPALVELAKLEFGLLNRPFEGEATCQRLLRIEPRAAFAHQRLIQYYALTLQREKLVKQIRFAISEKREPPEAYVYLLLLDSLRMGNGVKFNEIWLEAHPGQELFVVARTIQLPEPRDEQTGVPADERDASRQVGVGKLELVEDLLKKYPANLELLAYSIEHYITIGEVERVTELLSIASEAAAGDSRFWRFKGWVHESLDELPDAESAYKQALAIHPLDWNAWNRLAVVYRRRQNPGEVERLAALVEQARELRIKIRKLAAAELVTPEILSDLQDYATKCGVDWLAEALERRSGQVPAGIASQSPSATD
jgi:tetratricopeptide (TPR) repeat protein